MKLLKYKFVTVRAPDATRLDAFPDPLPSEKDEYAEFYLELNERDKRYRVSFSCIRVGSRILKSTNPKKLAGEIRAIWTDGHKNVQVSPIRLQSSRLAGDIVVYKRQDAKRRDFYLISVVVHDQDAMLHVHWKQSRDEPVSSRVILAIVHSAAFH